jgi:hypothetical protein
MKKLLLLSAILAGGVAATQAGMNFNIGIGVRVPAPRVAINAGAPYCAPSVVSVPQSCEQPVYQSSTVCEQPVVVTPQVCETPVYVQPRPVVIERNRYVYRGGHDWDRHDDYRRHDSRYSARTLRHDYR